MPNLGAPVRHIEPLIDPSKEVNVDHENLEREVENIKAGLAVVPGRVVQGPGRLVIGGSAKGRAQAEQERGHADNEELGGPAAFAEVVDRFTVSPWRQQCICEDGKRQKGEHQEIALAVQLDIAVDPVRVRVQSVEALDNNGNEHGQGQENDDIKRLEEIRERSRPADTRVEGSQETLSVEQVEDKEKQDARRDEYLRGHSQAKIMRMVGQGDPERVGHDARHAEAKSRCGRNELVPLPHVQLE